MLDIINGRLVPRDEPADVGEERDAPHSGAGERRESAATTG